MFKMLGGGALLSQNAGNAISETLDVQNARGGLCFLRMQEMQFQRL